MFDARRFGRLAAVQWAEYGRSYLWFLGIGVAIHLCAVLLITRGGSDAYEYNREAQMVLFGAGYLLTGGLFALRYFAALSERGSALTSLMRPGSTFEKFLLALLVVAVACPLAYTLAFQVCNLPGAYLGDLARDAKFAADPLGAGYLRNRSYGPYLPFTDLAEARWEIRLVLGNLFIQSLVLAGTLYFRRVAWLKTIVALFALVVLALPLLALLTGASPELLLEDSRRVDTLPVRAWLAVLWIGVPLVMWTSVFFLLKERELQ
jgi:hypothetical protein